jgi:heme-degrading monooxygenase HmoA
MAREHFASGNWLVRAGEEEDFIERWRDWIGASTKSVAGFDSATLMRDASDLRHFVSYSIWSDAASRDQWKASPEFAKGFAGCRELCDEFQGGDFEAVVTF